MLKWKWAGRSKKSRGSVKDIIKVRIVSPKLECLSLPKQFSVSWLFSDPPEGVGGDEVKYGCWMLWIRQGGNVGTDEPVNHNCDVSIKS